MTNSRVNICKGFLFLAVFSILMYCINFTFSWINTFSFALMLCFTIPFAILCFLCFVAHDIVADFFVNKNTKALKVSKRRVIIEQYHEDIPMYLSRKYNRYNNYEEYPIYKKAC